jgi:hypothetical protein
LDTAGPLLDSLLAALETGEVRLGIVGLVAWTYVIVEYGIKLG